ncbi:MAG: nickel-dependent lactate racemase [Candidatus Accumulibacter sp.]|jgi:nickel-dependent lactate racemase|nr:nickel-dependent lactate racemase [Accumulibacter sp.]
MYQIIKSGGSVTYRDHCENRSLSLRRENLLGLFAGKNPPALEDESVYTESLCRPVSGDRLSDIARGKKAKTAAILISDATRNVPTPKVAGRLVQELLRGGLAPEGITFFVALGVHRPASDDEIRGFVGDEVFTCGAHVRNHDAFDESNLVDLGHTSRNTPIRLNRAAFDCDVKITVGKVELHEMAGFSGGRKSVLPGIAAAETIAVNHRPEMIFNPGTGAGKLEGNPIHEDMLEVARRFGVDFSVNFVVNDTGQPAAVFAGGLEESHLAAVRHLRGYCTVTLPRRADILVAPPGIPLNCDMYQGVKAIIALQHILDGNSVVIFYGDFPEGMNSRDFMEPFRLFPDDLDRAREYAWNHFAIQMDHTLPMIDILKKGVRILAVTDTVPRQDIALLRMHWCGSLDEALDRAYAMTSRQAEVAFLPQPWRSIITEHPDRRDPCHLRQKPEREAAR